MTTFYIFAAPEGRETFFEGGVPPQGSQEVDEATWIARRAAAVEATRPPEPQPIVITYKADLFRRATDSEADMIDTALAAAPAKERRLFDMAQYLDHSAPEFASMQAALTGMFGADRTAELLAAS